MMVLRESARSFIHQYKESPVLNMNYLDVTKEDRLGFLFQTD